MIQNDRFISLHEASRILDVSIATLRRWDANGTLKATRVNGGHRKYLMSQIQKRLDIPNHKNFELQWIKLQNLLEKWNDDITIKHSISDVLLVMKKAMKEKL